MDTLSRTQIRLIALAARLPADPVRLRQAGFVASAVARGHVVWYATGKGIAATHGGRVPEQPLFHRRSQ